MARISEEPNEEFKHPVKARVWDGKGYVDVVIYLSDDEWDKAGIGRVNGFSIAVDVDPPIGRWDGHEDVHTNPYTCRHWVLRPGPDGVPGHRYVCYSCGMWGNTLPYGREINDYDFNIDQNVWEYAPHLRPRKE